MKELYYAEQDGYFCVKVGSFPCYYDKDYRWQRLNLAVVRRKNREHRPRLWTKR